MDKKQRQEREVKRGGGCLRTVGWLILGFLILVFIVSITNPDSPGGDTSESTVQPTAQENAPAARAPALETRDGEITKQEYGEDWPFSIESGDLYCDGPGSNVVMRSGGTVYALNGRAMGNAEENGYVIAKDAIQLTDEAGYYTVGSITKIIERGLAMC